MSSMVQVCASRHYMLSVMIVERSLLLLLVRSIQLEIYSMAGEIQTNTHLHLPNIYLGSYRNTPHSNVLYQEIAVYMYVTTEFK